MSVSPRTKAGCLMSLLLIMGVGVGFALGVIVSKVMQKKKETPVFWKEAAMKHLERLHPTEEQRQKFDSHTSKAVAELTALRAKGIQDVWEIVGRASEEVRQELTPEQQAQWEKIRPRPDAAEKK